MCIGHGCLILIKQYVYMALWLPCPSVYCNVWKEQIKSNKSPEFWRSNLLSTVHSNVRNAVTFEPYLPYLLVCRLLSRSPCCLLHSFHTKFEHKISMPAHLVNTADNLIKWGSMFAYTLYLYHLTANQTVKLARKCIFVIQSSTN